MRALSRLGVSAGLLLVLVVTTPSDGYERYEAQGGMRGCADCHPGFISRGPLHDLHVGPDQMTSECLLCHVSVGDNPRTSEGGAAGAQSCRGCHGRDNGTDLGWGAGLRLHHTASGVPPDMNGLRCANCHPGDPVPLPEDVRPVHYLRDDVNVKEPCSPMPPDGEDWDGDGLGLDNDGDLAYDEGDSDCISVGVGDVADAPDVLSVLSVTPNPAIGTRAEIVYALSAPGDVTIRVIDPAGRRVSAAHETSVGAGVHAFVLDTHDRDGRRLPSGIYLVEIEARGTVTSARVVILR